MIHAQAITSGDTFAYLPKERILITGDILVRPIPFSAGGTFPNDWIKTLQRLISLNPDIVIPGHGGPEGAKAALEQEMQLFQRIVLKVGEAKGAGFTESQAVQSIGKEDAQLVR